MIVQCLVHNLDNFTFVVNNASLSKDGDQPDDILELLVSDITPLQNVLIKVLVEHLQVGGWVFGNQLNELDAHLKIEFVNVDLLVFQCGDHSLHESLLGLVVLKHWEWGEDLVWVDLRHTLLNELAWQVDEVVRF